MWVDRAAATAKWRRRVFGAQERVRGGYNAFWAFESSVGKKQGKTRDLVHIAYCHIAVLGGCLS